MQRHITVREFDAGLGHETAQTNRQRGIHQMCGNRTVQMTQGTPARTLLALSPQCPPFCPRTECARRDGL